MDEKSTVRFKWAKRCFIALMITGAALATLGAGAGLIAKWYLESHSEALIGRKLAIGSIFVNFFRCSVTVNDVQLYEADGQTHFLSFDQFYVNAALYPLLSKEIVIEKVRLEKPGIRIVMHNDTFNFDDLMERFSQSDTTAAATDTSTDPSYKFRVTNISLSEGSIDLMNTTFHGELGVEHMSFACPEITSQKTPVDVLLDLSLKTGGVLSSRARFHPGDLTYTINLRGDSLNIAFLLPFVDKVMYVTDLQGKIDTELTVGGHIDKPVSEAAGLVRLSKFQLLDTLRKPSVKLDRFEITIDTVSAIEGNYAIRHALIKDPYLRFDLTSHGNNLVRNFVAPDSSAQQIARADSADAGGAVEDEYLNFFRLLNQYFVDLGRAYAINSYAIDTLSLSGGDIEFDDYTLNQQFHFRFEELSIQSRKIHSDQDSLKVKVDSRLNTSGVLDATLVLMPKDTGDLALTYSVKDLKVNDFSPYSEYYVAHPFWDGVVYFDSETTVVQKKLDSRNHLLITNLEVGDKVASKTAFNLPLKLAVSLLKDVRGNVDLNIPVKGNVDDPKFRVFPVVVKILRDLIIKAAAAPVKILARTFDASEDDLRDVKYDYLQYAIQKRQARSLNMLARVLNQKKDLHVKLVHMNNAEWEMNQYAVYESKLRFFCAQHGKQKDQLTADDSLAIDHVARLDSAFIGFLQQKLGKEVKDDVERACLVLVGEQQITDMLSEMNAKRIVTLSNYLGERVKTPHRFTIGEGLEKDKLAYRERPKFLMLFEATADSTRQQVR